MFCSNCGNELRQGLKYCNRCGAATTESLEKNAAATSAGSTAQALSIAVGWVGVAGIVALAILIGKILNRDDITPPHAILVMIFAAMVFGVVFSIVRQISKLSVEHPRAATDTESFARESLPRVADVPQLDPFRQPVGSVTEHTTRTFNEAFVKKTEN